MSMTSKLSGSITEAATSSLGQSTAAIFTPADIFANGEDGAYFTARDSTAAYTVGGAVDGTITDLSGNGNDFSGAGCTLEEDANGFKYIDTVDNAGHISYSGLATLPSDLTLVEVLETTTDTLGYFFSDKGGNKGIGIYVSGSGGKGLGAGITATVNHISFNGKVYADPTYNDLYQIMQVTGKCVITYSLSDVVGTTVDFGVGNTNSGSTYSSPHKTTAGLWINRVLTAAEEANLVTYFNATFGKVHKGTPYDADIINFKGQSPIVGAANDGTISSPAMTEGNLSINYKVDTDELDFPLADPINNNTLGQSIVPAFANRWFQRTGRPICSVMSAVGGSSLLPYASSDWGTNGAILAASKANINEAVAALAVHADYEVNAIYDVYSSGQTEVLNWNGTTIEDTNFRTGMVSLADDAKTWYDANHAGLFQGTYSMLINPRYNDASARGMQFIDLTERTNDINTAIVNAAGDTANLTVGWKGGASHFALSYQDGWNYDGVHRATRAVQETGELTVDGIVNSLADPATPTSVLLGSDLFIDTSQSTKNSRTESVTTASGSKCLMIPVSGHLFTNGSGQIDFDVTFDGVKMSRGASIEVEESTAGEVGSAVFYLNEHMFGGSLSGVTGDVVVSAINIGNTAKTLNVINFAALYHADVYRPERVKGNIDLKNATTASHEIKPLLDSFLVNVTAGNYHSATGTTATVANLTELYDSSYTITSSSKTAQFAVSYGSVAAETAITPSVTFAASQKEIAPFTVAMRRQYVGEG